MKRKTIVFLVSAILALALMPALQVGAIQGTLAALSTTGYSAEADDNVVTVSITDADLNVARQLEGDGTVIGAAAGKLEIIGTADGSTTSFTVDATHKPIGTLTSVFDVQGGQAYIVAVSDAKDGVTLHEARGAVVAQRASFAAVKVDVTTDQTVGGQVAAAKIQGVVTDKTGTDTTGTTVNVVIKGTSINPATLAETAADTEVLAFNAASGTPDTKITTKYFKQGTVSFQTNTTSTNATDGYDIVINETRTIAARFDYSTADNTDFVSGSTTTKTVKVVSAADPTGLSLTAKETGASTNKFERDVVLTTVARFDAINKELTDAATDLVVDTNTIGNLITELEKQETSETDAEFAADNLVADWVTAMATNRVVIDPSTSTPTKLATTDTIDKLTGVLLRVGHGDTVTVTYTDKSSGAASASRSASVDTLAPVISDVSITDTAVTNDSTPLLSAKVVDVDSKIDASDIVLCVNGTVSCASGSANEINSDLVSKDPVTDGFIVSYISASLGDGPHTWELVVKDKVGNSATTGDTAVTTKQIKFTVDSALPAMTGAAAGIGIKASTTVSGQWDEFASKDWIKVTFGEKLATASVSTGDFDIVGSSPPAEVAIQKRVKLLGETSTDTTTDHREIVYLKVSTTLAPDAKPAVSLVDAVDDLAGNSAQKVTATNTTNKKTSTDNTKPALTVSLGSSLGLKDDLIVVTVTSDENLVTTPAVTAGSTSVTLTSTGTNTWSGSYKIKSADLDEFTVTASGTDKASPANTGTKTAKFQADTKAPLAQITINDASATTAGIQVETADVIFIPVNFDDNSSGSTFGDGDKEYTGDTHTKVTIDSAKLDTLDKLGTGATVQSTQTLTADDFQTSNTINYVYGATDLPIGFYKLTVTGKDEAGNKSAATPEEFAVIAQAKTSIAVNPGWTLISLSGRPQDRSIATVMDGTSVTQIWSFNNTAQVWEFARLTEGVWEGTLTQITDGRAYFVRGTTFDPIKVLLERFSPQRSQPQYVVTRGWNGIGYTAGGTETSANATAYLSSLAAGGSDVGWGVIRWWNPTTQRYESAWPNGDMTAGFPSSGGKAIVEAGKGYLLYATRSGVLAP